MIKRLVLVALLAACAPALAIAAADFVKVDSNADGQVSLEELIAAGMNWDKDKFAAADTDKSGALSNSEFSASVK